MPWSPKPLITAQLTAPVSPQHHPRLHTGNPLWFTVRALSHSRLLFFKKKISLPSFPLADSIWLQS